MLVDGQRVPTFFHHSGVHSCELEKVAKNHFPDLKLLHFPQLFQEERFLEFTPNLLKSFVRNIPVCLFCWKELSFSKEARTEEKNRSKGFMKIWLSKDKLQLIHAFLDVVEIVECLQMQFRNKQLTILDVEPLRDATLAKIKQML